MPRKALSKKTKPSKSKKAKRPRRQNNGSNDERKSTLFEPIGRYLGGAGGAFLGGPSGALVGSSLGSTAGSLISKLTGFGSYHVSRNTIMTDSIPQFTSRMGDGTIRIRHKEFITDVVSSSTIAAFQNLTYHISASDQQTFPYLSQIAINFEEYAFEGLVFQYVTSSGSLSTTGQLGTVVGAVQFNSLATPYINKQQMEASTFGQSTVASQSCLFPVECDAAQTPSNGIFYNVRPGISNINNDPRWSQLGIFNLATVGMPAASEVVGELYVSYDCVLMKPILIQDSGAAADHWTGTAGIATTTQYFGTDAALTPQSDNFTLASGATLSIDPSFNGKIEIVYTVFGAAGAWVMPTITAGVGVTALNIWSIGTHQLNALFDVATAFGYTVATFSVRSVGVPSTIFFGGGTFFTPVLMDLVVTQMPADFD